VACKSRLAKSPALHKKSSNPLEEMVRLEDSIHISFNHLKSASKGRLKQNYIKSRPAYWWLGALGWEPHLDSSEQKLM
jgi:hypothetical protein